MVKNITITLLSIALFLTLKECNRSKISNSEKESLLFALNDTIEQNIDKLGRQTSQISVLIGEKSRLTKDLVISDSIIERLKKVSENAENYAIISTVEKTDTETVVIQEIRYDTIFENQTQQIFPVYTYTWDDKWSSGYIEATKDSLYKNLLFLDEFDIWTERVKVPKRGKVLKVFWRNNNPHTKTTDLRSFLVEEKPKKFAVIVGLSSGVGSEFNSFEPKFFYGVNVTLGYKIFEF